MLNEFKLREDLKILFNPKTSQMHRLDDMGVLFVKELKKNGSVKAIENLAHQFDIDKKIIKHDIDGFLNNILKENYEIDLDIEKRHEEKLKFSLRLEIEVTSLCNWNCGFCYNVWKIDPNLDDKEVKKQIKMLPQKHLPKEVIFKVLKDVEEFFEVIHPKKMYSGQLKNA